MADKSPKRVSKKGPKVPAKTKAKTKSLQHSTVLLIVATLIFGFAILFFLPSGKPTKLTPDAGTAFKQQAQGGASGVTSAVKAGVTEAKAQAEKAKVKAAEGAAKVESEVKKAAGKVEKEAKKAAAKVEKAAKDGVKEAAKVVGETVEKAAPKVGDEEGIVYPEGKDWKKEIVQEGDGKTFPAIGDKVKMHYTGFLLDGTKFDSSHDRGQPFEARIGVGNLIRGWDEAVPTMSKGEKAKFTISWKAAYGEAGSPPVIPAKADLIFEVELVDVTPSPPDIPWPEKDPKVIAVEGLDWSKVIYEEGDGENFPQKGDKVLMHYTGRFASDGKKFDSSHDRGHPLALPVGLGQIIRGWDEGVPTMSKGEKAKLYVNSGAAYGERGAGNGLIPPGSDLVFEVELVDIQRQA
ncbi:hypothetical protein HDV00_000610 [Rhizophlyctis rosea]|nr:hypothetical protein HDV00_000610 [Rhizophlyctis rosea]